MSTSTPGWWQPDHDQPQSPGPKRGNGLIAVLIAIAVLAVAALGAFIGIVVSGRSTSAVATAKTTTTTTTAPPPTITTTTTNAVQAANQVASCMRLHNMQYAETMVSNASTSGVPFLQRNPEPYSSSDPIYENGSPTVTLFEWCAWPPPGWADATGFYQALFTTVPGSTSWPGEVNTNAYADMIDTTCPSVTAEYSGGHTGSSFSDTATVASNGIAQTEPGGEGADGAAPPSLASWAQSVGFFLLPGESAILHTGDESVSSVQCSL